MADYSVAEARNNLSKLIERAEKGETITITRHGKVAAQIVGAQGAGALSPSRTDWRAALEKVIANQVKPKGGPIDATQLIREMRDEGY